MSFRHTLSGRLFRLVFGGYVVLALLVTAVQLGLEFRTTQRTVGSDLAALGDSFRDSITKAIWELDRIQLETMAQGLHQSAIVSGVRIVTPDRRIMASAGEIPEPNVTDRSGLFAPFQVQTLPLVHMTPLGPRHLGSFSLYSSRSIVVARVQQSFFVILINSIVKTAGLWLIFVFVISRVLARPLNELSDVVSHIEFGATSNGDLAVDYPHEDELGRLIASMNTMRARLDIAQRELKEANRNLESTVAERTQHLSEALDFNRKILTNSPIPMSVYAEDGQCILANQALADMVGTDQNTMIKLNFHQLESWRQSGMLDDALAALNDETPRKNEVHLVTTWGRELWLSYHMLPTVIHGEKRLLVQFSDQTSRKKLENELRDMAYHDALTQLPNRRLLLDRLNRAIRSSKRENSHAALLYLDLNRFKELNDRHGHDVGDLLLVEVGRRLCRIVRDTDTVARLAGDEFVVLIEGLGPDAAQAKEIAVSVIDKIYRLFVQPFTLGTIQHTVTTSVGLRLFLGDQADADQIIKDADTVMYAVKKNMSA